MPREYRAWGACDGCGFQGLMPHRCRDDEDYEDEEALGFMMDVLCPSCGQLDATLVVVDEYREMLFLARPRTP
ncbi:MAG: hypothetical protein H6983_14475 [Ectothiorhodospiraceae bacterium]|nr:hypothetical protein [Ectothiorhodospiraceae bacterium]